MREDIQKIYFNLMTENERMKRVYSHKVNFENMDYNTMTQCLTDFAQANLSFMDFMYTEQAYEGEMEFLSEEEKASMWIANALSMGQEQWREKLQCLGQAAKVCPMLGDFTKRYIKLLGEQLMK